MGTIMEYLPNLGELSNHFRGCKTLCISELLGVAYTQIRNPDSNLSLLGRS